MVVVVIRISIDTPFPVLASGHVVVHGETCISLVSCMSMVSCMSLVVIWTQIAVGVLSVVLSVIIWHSPFFR